MPTIEEQFKEKWNSRKIVFPFEQPDLRPIRPDGHYQVGSPFIYWWMYFDEQNRPILNRIEVPTGFISDGASAPRIIWTISGILPDGLIRAAALIHDFLYRYAGCKITKSHYYSIDEGSAQIQNDLWTKKQVDMMLARIMREADVSTFKRRAAYLAVRMFAGSAWKRHLKKSCNDRTVND